MLYHCFASFKQSLLDFFKLLDSRLIFMLLYDSINLIISGVHHSPMTSGLYNTRCVSALLLKDKIIIHNVFGSY